MSRGPDAAAVLRRVIERDARAAGCDIVLGEMRTTRWASATFVGARHCVTLSVADDAASAAWLGGLAEAELPMRGHLVADLHLMATRRGAGRAEVEIEALTVEV
jgi:hypothetical protein